MAGRLRACGSLRKGLLRDLLCGIAIAAMPTAANAQTPGLPYETQAQMVYKLWVEACAMQPGNAEAQKKFAIAKLFQANPPYAASALAGEKGTVYDVSVGPYAQIMLVVYDNGMCQARSRRADVRLTNELFGRTIVGINRPGVVVRKTLDHEVTVQGIVVRQIAYFVGRADAETGYVFLATTTASEQAAAQAKLSTVPAKKP